MSPGSTIAAVSTAPGVGAVSIIRLSGPDSLAVLKRVFTPLEAAAPRMGVFTLSGNLSLSQGVAITSAAEKRYGQSPSSGNSFQSPPNFEVWRPRQMRYGRIQDPENARLLDEVLAVWFPAPHSFTGEEVCEIQGHGGLAVTGLVLAAVLRAGAELAQPGEFTRRAFMNGRLDLAQAEAVADLVAARSAAEIGLAARQLAGGLSEKVEAIHRALFSALAELTADIDFGDDLEALDLFKLGERLRSEALTPLEKLLADGRAGRPFREGLRLALVGAPNVGKSSLFNALLGSDRALVSDLPGTTRDFITAGAAWSGLAVELCDTAGLSAAPRDELDALGQDRSRAQLAQADLVLWVRDSTRAGLEDEALDPAELPLDRTLLVWNKIDLAPPPGPEWGNAPPQVVSAIGRPDHCKQEFAISSDCKSDDLQCTGFSRHQPYGLEGRQTAVSARSGAGLDQLKAAILKLATGREDPSPPEVAPNLRHQAALTRTAAILAETLADLSAGQPADICALGLRSALDALEVILGRSTPDDILNEIFSRFCLGK